MIVILLDDLGFSDLGCFGSEIATPAIDRLASGGLRFTDYTTVPMCTPARAALLTGKNPHAVGCGWLTSADPGYPGYVAGEIASDVHILPELLRLAGYGTYGAGKWHNTPDHEIAPAARRDTWPLARGFDEFYGFLGAESSYKLPGHLVRDNQFIDVTRYPDDYYLTDDITQAAIGFLRQHVSDRPDKPFFLYLPFNAPHTPMQARADDLASVRGHYAEGWDTIRAARLARQRALGIAAPNWRMPPNPNEMPLWTDVPLSARASYTRHMERYAAMIRRVDHNVGLLLDELEHLECGDDTLIVLTSDNGANAIGGKTGAMNVAERRAGAKDDAAESDVHEADDAGSWPIYPVGWANVSNAPFRYYKRTPMNGGVRVPLILSWPGRIRDPGAIRPGWIHVTDILPTLLDVLEISRPAQRGGVPTREPDGLSFAPLITDARAVSRRRTQHYEMEGNRAYRRGRHKIVSLQPTNHPIDLDKWMLFDLDADPTEIDDLAGDHPELLRELVEAFANDADANFVYPLDNRGLARSLSIPPYLEQLVDTPRRFFAGSPSASRDTVSPLIADRDFTLEAVFDVAPGDRGVLVAIGDAFAGLVLLVDDGVLELHNVRWRRPGTPVRHVLPTGRVLVSLRHAALGSLRGRGTLVVNETVVATDIDMSPTIVRLASEGLDVGIDRRQSTLSPMSGPDGFPYTNRIAEVRIIPGPQAPDSLVNRHEAEAQHQ